MRIYCKALCFFCLSAFFILRMMCTVVLNNIYGNGNIKKGVHASEKRKFCSIYNTSIPLNAQQKSYSCPLLKTKPPIHICLYKGSDHQASAHIKRNGSWEENIGSLILNALNENPESGLIDIGASIGIHSLPAAKMGYKVIAVEPSRNNIRHLHKSAVINNIKDSIIIVQNAFSDTRGDIYAHRGLNSQNPGLQTTVKNKTSHRIIDTYKAIFMDDLLEVITFQTAVMKIDIEGAEPLAFQKAKKLFQKIDIRTIFMEWGYCLDYYWIKQLDGKIGIEILHKMVKFLSSNGFEAWSTERIPVKLDVQNMFKWPWDIIWMKKDYSL